jgi:hypothetical protein
MEAEQFCRWLNGARELGALKDGVDEGQRTVILERLREVQEPIDSGLGRGVPRESPSWRFVRNFRGLVDLGLDWTAPHIFTRILLALNELFYVTRKEAPTRQPGGCAVA